MKRLLLLSSAALLPLAAAPAIANETERLPRPALEAYALAPQATLAAPTLLPSATTGMTILPMPTTDARVAASLTGSPGPQLRMASIGGVMGPAGGAAASDLQAQSSDAFGERLPSTPVALAALFLMICILVGRRSRPEEI